jgi:hypothetical protein
MSLLGGRRHPSRVRRYLGALFVASLALAACSATEASGPPDSVVPLDPPVTEAVPLQPGEPGTFYVAPDGDPSGRGTERDPWDLARALSGEGVAPGSTIWVGGGTYQGPFTSTLAGSAEAPIVVRQVSGERARILGPVGRDAALSVRGQQTWFWGFEVLFEDPVRQSAEIGANPASLNRSSGIDVKGPGTRLINLIVHDAADAIGFWSEAPDSEIYGSIIFNNGFEGERGWGHGIYTQNISGTKALTDNVIFNQFGAGIHAYGSSNARLDGYVLEGNIAFSNGVLSPSVGYYRNILLGGGATAASPTLRENYTFTPRASGAGENNLGYDAGCTDATVTGNYFVEDVPLKVVKCTLTEVRGNTFIGATNGLSSDEHPDNRYLDEPPSDAVDVFVRPNRYETGRAHIVVYNWREASHVDLDLTATGLEIGQRFTILDVQDLEGPPAVEGTWDGAPVRVDMRRQAITPPIGIVPVQPQHTGPEFGAFLVLPG